MGIVGVPPILVVPGYLIPATFSTYVNKQLSLMVRLTLLGQYGVLLKWQHSIASSLSTLDYLKCWHVTLFVGAV